MSVISVTAAQLLRRSTSQTKKLTKNLSDLNRLRSAAEIMQKDIQKAFNFRDLNMFLYNEAVKERAKRYEQRKKDWVDKQNKEKNLNPPMNVSSLNEQQKADMIKEIGDLPKETLLKKEKIVTHFKGDKEKFFLTSAAGVRFRSEDKVSNLIEVGYFIKTCKSKRNLKVESDCLWRSVSYNLDGEVTEDGEASVLIENIDEFKVKYLSYSKTDEPEWIESWDSKEARDSRFGNMFPAAVSVQLTAKFPRSKDGEKTKTEELFATFPINFSNNNPFKKLKKSNPTSGIGL